MPNATPIRVSDDKVDDAEGDLILTALLMDNAISEPRPVVPKTEPITLKERLALYALMPLLFASFAFSERGAEEFYN